MLHESTSQARNRGRSEAATFDLASLALPLEVRVHGRGGQGGVTCAKLIAALYTQLGLQVQAFGDYGSERSGAPIQAFTRVDRQAIANRNKVYQPDHLIVLDEALMGPDVLSGASPGALLLLNTASRLDFYAGQYAPYRFAVIDATAIAREHGIGSSSVVIINTTILGAYARLLGLPVSALEAAYISLGLGDDLAAAEHAYALVQTQAGSGARADPGAFAATTLQPALPPVAPITEHSADHPATLKTGSWSTQVPRYREHPAPCNLACPAGNDVRGFIHALHNEGAEAAAAVLWRTQPLPSVCGRVCPAPCMSACNRTAFDGAVNIRSLERWIADHSAPQLARQTATRRLSFAVVGGGPAGLSAAYQLALCGHTVTIHEAGPALGGVLRNGIPAFRLPQDVLQRDVDRILALGVEARCNARLDKAGLLRLQAEHDALIVCTGFGPALDLAVDGAGLPGVEQGLEFLDRVKRGSVELRGQVVIVGGGNTAIDCARTALRCGASAVKLVYRRGRDEMPAIAEEIDSAEREGVRLETHRQPVAFAGNGAVSAVILAEVEAGPPDASGRRCPLVSQRTASLACDTVLLALGQRTQMAMPDGWRMQDGRAWQDEIALDVWFAGDCANGEGTVTHAIGNGRRVALSALAALTRLADLGGELATPLGPSLSTPAHLSPSTVRTAGEGSRAESIGEGAVAPVAPVAPAQIRFSHFELAPPHRDKELAPSVRRGSFAEANLGLAGPEEAGRCFSCGQCTQCDTCLIYCPDGAIFRSENGDRGYRIATDYCKGCGMCVAECPRSAIEMSEKNKRETQKVSSCL